MRAFHVKIAMAVAVATVTYLPFTNATSAAASAAYFTVPHTAAASLVIQAAETKPPVTRADEIIRIMKFIQDVRYGTLDMNEFEPALGAAVEEQKAVTEAMLAGLGKITGISFADHQNGGDAYKVSFEHADMVWWIKLELNGKLAGLRAMPAAGQGGDRGKDK